MSYSKQFGPLMISESAGVVSLSVSVSQSVGGGEAAGVITAQASASAQISAKQAIDMGLELAAVKFPGASAIISAAQSAIDAEIAKL